jgi:hypothetical protein
MNTIQLILFLWAGHYLADFPLQPEYVATNKRKILKESIGFHCLTAHAFIQGLVAGFITQKFSVALIVGLTHWLIDFGKSCEYIDDRFPHTKGARNEFQSYGLYGINIDQTLHFIVIVAVVLLGVAK